MFFRENNYVLLGKHCIFLRVDIPYSYHFVIKDMFEGIILLTRNI